jgi:hypothetical protein
LEQQFGPAFTPQLREAWITLYGTVQSEMMGAAGLANENVPPAAFSKVRFTALDEMGRPRGSEASCSVAGRPFMSRLHPKGRTG